MELESFYKDPQVPGSFGGINALHRALKGKVKTGKITNWNGYEQKIRILCINL